MYIYTYNTNNHRLLSGHISHIFHWLSPLNIKKKIGNMPYITDHIKERKTTEFYPFYY